MKKYIFSISALLYLGTLSAQVRTVNSATNGSVTNSPAFIDASSNTTVNGSSNVGKGLIFPRVDLSAMTAFPSVTAGIPNSFPTRFDGMIVYNTASSGTAGVGATQGTLSPGYWYYENKSSSNTGGTWKPVSTATAAVANTASNGLTLAGNDVKLGGTLSQATDIATSGNNLTISGTGNVGIGTASPSVKLEVNNGTTAGALKIVDGTQGVGKVLVSDANGIATWKDTTGNPIIINSTVGNGIQIDSNMKYTGASAVVTIPGPYLISTRIISDKTPAGCGDYLAYNLSKSSTAILNPAFPVQDVHMPAGIKVHDFLFTTNIAYLTAGTYYMMIRNDNTCTTNQLRTTSGENAFTLTLLK